MAEAAQHLLLTGATGFFGKALLRHWAASGQPAFRVIGLSRDPQAFARHFQTLANQPWLQWHQGDICNPDSLPHDTRFTCVIHAATDSTLGPRLSPTQRYTQIVDGTRNLLDFAVRNGRPRFLLTSSGGVYGSPPPDLEKVPESYLGIPDPLLASSTYGLSKRMAEHLCALAFAEHSLPIAVARCFAFVGEDLPLDVHFAIGNFIRDALWADEIVVNGDGSPLRSYLDQRDLAHWLMTLLRKGKAGEAYNVGSDQAISISDLAHLVRDLVSPDKRVRILGKPAESAQRNRYIPDTSKIARDLGLRPSFSLEQSILDVAKAARQSRWSA